MHLITRKSIQEKREAVRNLWQCNRPSLGVTGLFQTSQHNTPSQRDTLPDHLPNLQHTRPVVDIFLISCRARWRANFDRSRKGWKGICCVYIDRRDVSNRRRCRQRRYRKRRTRVQHNALRFVDRDHAIRTGRRCRTTLRHDARTYEHYQQRRWPKSHNTYSIVMRQFR